MSNHNSPGPGLVPATWNYRRKPWPAFASRTKTARSPARDEIRDFLKPFGIWYEKWDVEGRLPAGGDERADSRDLCSRDRAAQEGGQLCHGGRDQRLARQRPTSTRCSPSSARSTRTARTRCGSPSKGAACFTFIRRAARLRHPGRIGRSDQRSPRHAALVRPVQRQDDPLHSPVPGHVGLDAALRRAGRTRAVSPRLPRTGLRAAGSAV